MGSESVGMVHSEHDGSDTDTSAAELLSGVVLPASHQELRSRFQQERFEESEILPHVFVNLQRRSQTLQNCVTSRRLLAKWSHQVEFAV